MLHSLRLRLLLMMILVVLVAIGAVALFASRATSSEFQRYVEHGGMQRHRRFQAVLAVYYERNGSWDGVQLMVEQMGQVTGERIVVVDQAGRVVADSGRKLLGQPGGVGWDGPATSITVNGSPVGAVYVDPLEGSKGGAGEAVFLGAVNRSLLLAVVAAGLGAVLLSLTLARRILQPVEALTAAARRMEKGDLRQRVNVQSKDEIGQLAHAFNAMADGLAHLEQLRRNMVTDVAHELRTPLSNIRGYLEAIRDGLVEPSPAVVDSLYEEAMLLNRLVDDLQELALVEGGQLRLVRQPVAVEEIIAKTVAVVQPQARAKQLALRVELPADEPAGQHQSLMPVDADPERVAQMLRNLLNNAITHTPPGGEIVVAAGTAGTTVEVSVRDTGAGIAPEHLPYVFERFYRADKSRTRATGGTGLGLAIVKQLVEAHGGRVGVESAVGEGTTFTFTLPVAAGTAERAAPTTRSDL